MGRRGWLYDPHKKVKFHASLKSFVFYKDESQYQILGIRDITDIIKSERRTEDL